MRAEVGFGLDDPADPLQVADPMGQVHPEQVPGHKLRGAIVEVSRERTHGASITEEGFRAARSARPLSPARTLSSVAPRCTAGATAAAWTGRATIASARARVQPARSITQLSGCRDATSPGRRVWLSREDRGP